MKIASETIKLTQKLINRKSITPKDDGAIITLKKELSRIGFTNTDLPFGSIKNNDLIHNLFSIYKSQKKKSQSFMFCWTHRCCTSRRQ